MGWLEASTGSLAETFCNIIELIRSKQIQTDVTSRCTIKCDLNSIIIKPYRHRIYYFDCVFALNLLTLIVRFRLGSLVKTFHLSKMYYPLYCIQAAHKLIL